jgi:hypothetical protein
MTATPTGSDEMLLEAAGADALGSEEPRLAEALGLPEAQAETIRLIRRRAAQPDRVVTGRCSWRGRMAAQSYPGVQPNRR